MARSRFRVTWQNLLSQDFETTSTKDKFLVWWFGSTGIPPEGVIVQDLPKPVAGTVEDTEQDDELHDVVRIDKEITCEL